MLRWYVIGSSVIKCVQEVLSMIRFIEHEWTSKVLILEMTRPMTEFSDPQLHFLVNCLSSFCVTLVSAQATAVTTYGNAFVHAAPKVTSAAAETTVIERLLLTSFALQGSDRVSVYTNRKKTHVYSIAKDTSHCTCMFHQVYKLPCVHLIWYELRVLKHKQVSMQAVHERWFLKTFKLPAIPTQRESNEVRLDL